MKRITVSRLALTAAIAAATAATAPAMAQLEEIIVTAQKREQSLLDVPLSVATLSGERFSAIFEGGADIRGLSARVPGLYVESSNGRAAPRFYMRGLGNIDFDLAASQPVSIIMDDVVKENVVLKSFPLFDVEQVEVLRGPQGSLFGRNTTAGIVKFDSRKPTRDLEGRAKVDIGELDTLN
ncbi:MAG TPA: TonB-dependent receptor, partial [Halieaceae bacterium]|nr:TonB-dependent receptor [Halieaceae bacterium]